MSEIEPKHDLLLFHLSYVFILIYACIILKNVKDNYSLPDVILIKTIFFEDERSFLRLF